MVNCTTRSWYTSIKLDVATEGVNLQSLIIPLPKDPCIFFNIFSAKGFVRILKIDGLKVGPFSNKLSMKIQVPCGIIQSTRDLYVNRRHPFTQAVIFLE